MENEVKVYELKNGERIDTGRTYIRGSNWNEGEEELYIVGANVYQIKSDLEKYKDVDLSTGASMEFLVKERVSLSFEYKNHKNEVAGVVDD